MSLGIGRSFLSGPNIAIVYLPRGCSKSNPLFRSSESRRSTIRSFGSLTTLLETSIQSRPRAASTHASFAKSGGQKTSWDEAADSYFSEDGVKEATPPSKSAGKMLPAASMSRNRRGLQLESPTDRPFGNELSSGAKF